MHPYELMAKVCHLCVEHQRLSDPNSDKVMMCFELYNFLLYFHLDFGKLVPYPQAEGQKWHRGYAKRIGNGIKNTK